MSRRHVGRRFVALAGCAGVLTATVASGARPVVIPIPDQMITGGIIVVPKRLPEDRKAPAALSQDLKIKTSSGARPPAVREIAFKFDRRVALDATGLPICLPTVEIASIRQACRDSIVGEGSAGVDIRSPETDPILLRAHVTVFNAQHRSEFPRLRALLFFREPAPAVVSMPIVVRPARQSGYRYRAEAKVPVFAGGNGSLVDLRLRIGRRWTYEGTRHSLVEARCVANHFQSRTEVEFVDEEIFVATSVQPCVVRG